MKTQTLHSPRGRGFRILQRGQGMTEYVIIVALVAIAAITAFTEFGGTMRSMLGATAMELSGQSGAAAQSNAKKHASNVVNDGNAKKSLAKFTGEN